MCRGAIDGNMQQQVIVTACEHMIVYKRHCSMHDLAILWQYSCTACQQRKHIAPLRGTCTSCLADAVQ